MQSWLLQHMLAVPQTMSPISAHLVIKICQQPQLLYLAVLVIGQQVSKLLWQLPATWTEVGCKLSAPVTCCWQAMQ